MNRPRLLLIIILGLLALTPAAVLAQSGGPRPIGTPVSIGTPTPTATPSATPTLTPTPDPGIPRVHIVQEGETLFYIAALYGVSVEALQAVNNLSDDALITIGQALIIPGGEGEAVTTLYRVGLGDTLAGIAADFNTTVETVAEANGLVNPDHLVVGQTLAVVSRTGSEAPRPLQGQTHVVRPGQTLLSLAAGYGLNPADLAAANDLPFPAYLFPGQRLRIPGDGRYQFLPGEWTALRIRPLPIVQGQTVAIYVENLLPGAPGGQLAGRPLRFTPQGDGFVALVGLDAFTEPGVYPLELTGSGPERPWFPFRQDVRIDSGGYATQYITIGDELGDLLDPDIRVAEDAYLATFYNRFSEPRQWEGLFQTPVTTTFISAPYGDARSYNGQPVEIFHSGTDYAAPEGTAVLAPAAGTVIFNEPTDLRGNVIIIDHGLGVMTGYYHLNRSLVNVGDAVQAGQQIGEMGTTGLSSGVHLHWEVRVNGAAVDGPQWLREPFP